VILIQNSRFKIHNYLLCVQRERTFVGWDGRQRRAHEGVSKSKDFAIFLENKEKNRTPIRSAV
jgi:hypothetical protein